MENNELLSAELLKFLGKEIKLYLKNGFFYQGKILDLDNNFLVLFDFKTQQKRVFNLDCISSFVGVGE